MPELPEIETVKLQLKKVLVGKKLLKIEVVKSRTVKGDINKLIGQKLADVERKGKVLLLDFGRGDKLGFHFKMTGQLIYVNKNTRIVGGHPTQDFVGELPSKHTRVVFEFDEGILYFNDQRLFGWVEINPKFVDSLGPEPIEMSKNEAIKLIELIKRLKRPIKVAIMDQEIISGVGNIYANDALWEAGINPTIRSDQLSVNRLIKLFESINKVLKEGIKYGGATAADKKYTNLHGLGGHYQEHFRVYDREGEPCIKCKTKIVKITLGGRGTYYCPICQK